MSRHSIFESSLDYFLAPISDYLNDETVTEVMVNGHRSVYIERRGKLHRTSAAFDSEDALLSAVHNIAQFVGRQINPQKPILDARLPDGSRVNAIIPPSARHGVTLTIRKFSRQALTLENLIEFGSISPSAKEFLEICVRLHKNIIVSGGTGTGKTSLLGAVSRAVPEEERIIVIEDTNELRLIQDHCLYLEVQQQDQYGRGGLTIRDLFVNSLRMRPDRIIVGEVRGGEALDLIQSMLSGHAGSLSTVHANTPRDALIRLETLSLMSDVEIPVYVARAQVASAINLVVQLTRFTEDGSRKITRITEVMGLDSDEQYKFTDLFRSQHYGKGDDGMLQVALEETGTLPTFSREAFEQGMDGDLQFSKKLWSQ